MFFLQEGSLSHANTISCLIPDLLKACSIAPIPLNKEPSLIVEFLNLNFFLNQDCDPELKAIGI